MASVMTEVGTVRPRGKAVITQATDSDPSNGADGTVTGGGNAELLLTVDADLASGMPIFPRRYKANVLPPQSIKKKSKSKEDMHTGGGNTAIEGGISRTRNCSQKRSNHRDEKRKDARGSKKIFYINGKKKCEKKSGTQNDCAINEWNNEQTNCNLKNEEICFFGGDENNIMDYTHLHGKHKSVPNREERQGNGKKITSNGHVVSGVKQSAHVRDTSNHNVCDKKDGKSVEVNHVDREEEQQQLLRRGTFQRGRRNHYNDGKFGREQPNVNYYDRFDYVKRERMMNHYKKLDAVYSSHSRRSNPDYHPRGGYRNEPTSRGTTDRWHRYYPNGITNKSAEGGTRDQNGTIHNSGHAIRSPLNNPPHGRNTDNNYPNNIARRRGSGKTTFSHTGEHEKERQKEVPGVQVNQSVDSLQQNFAHTNEVHPNQGKTHSQFNLNEKSEEHFTYNLHETNERSIPTLQNSYLNESSPGNMVTDACRRRDVLEKETEKGQTGPYYIHHEVKNNDVVEIPRAEPNRQSTNNDLEKKDGTDNTPSGGTNQKDTPPMGGSHNANDNLRKLKREEEKKKVMNWKLEEQTLLEEGLRVYKDLKNCPEKWEKVSEIVKTKGPEDCLKRFLYCRFIEGSDQANNEEMDQDIDSDDMNINNNVNITGKSLVLGNVHIKNISLYKAIQLKLQLLCTRCCNTFDVTTTSKDAPQLVCTCVNCSSNAVVEVYRNICFMENSCVCVLKFNQCSLMDLLSGDYSVNCESCGRKSILKNVTSGKEMHVNCQKCFTKLEFKYSGFSFDEIVNANNAAIKKIDEMINKLFTKKKSNKKALAPANNLKIEKCKNVIKVNNIEVKDGACKHFKKSHRLFKFPCCNKIFPCPTCHDLNSNHECGIAKRVICGFCFREFDDDDVCVCQRDKKTKKGGNFWEGGKGCRNAITLSKNDSKKYKLLNRQTVQKKKKK
ncbi:Uncharacterized protein PCOAH_00016070 [Plasmodium coatneyi]|uniref:CHY-type domain-containing protein n=1 Tax=Plasmodium coatneyi TaxID=208452 RepID=A0A1B1DXH9_9APIC|nr:Uncharacterized protein PCOAH_00016070 [Plasmodium coatneyi]ANQ07483.1 Uncharacterized protein PCOAH_00016070 [Plasmodium coatneyi]